MHMADALLSPAIGLTMIGVSTVAIGVGCYQLRKRPDCHEKLPLLAMAGAFVFAAQMINFTIPGTGSSGHIGGGILLASLLGLWPALIALSVVLLIQCLFFADGGLLALGCNIFNMGIIPCLCVYPLMRKFISKQPIIGCMASALIALPLGAFAVVLETFFSGITQLPFVPFTSVMVPIHLAIAIGEGLATAAIVIFIAKTRPNLLDFHLESKPAIDLSNRTLILIALFTTLLTGLGLSAFASSLPDGLEWSVEKTNAAMEMENSLDLPTAFFPDYELPDASWPTGWLAALTGILLVMAVCVVLWKLLPKHEHEHV